MFTSCLEKQNKLIQLFKQCSNDEECYKKIIEFGRALPSFNLLEKNEANLVPGCQSVMYLHAEQKGECLSFNACSDALISAGLAAILIEVYSGETAETILKCAPDFLNSTAIPMRLTPSRANGLYSIHHTMKQKAIKFLIAKTS